MKPINRYPKPNMQNILEYHLLKNIMSNAGGNFISDKFKRLCKKSEHIANSIIIIPSPKQYNQKCIDTKSQMHISLFQIR